MRIARVLGTVTLDRMTPELKPGRYLICEKLEARGLVSPGAYVAREKPMPESLVVFDDLGAGAGELIAVSEGREASMPWYPERVPIDADCCAILDSIDVDGELIDQPAA